jgi:hypothetical protein
MRSLIETPHHRAGAVRGMICVFAVCATLTFPRSRAATAKAQASDPDSVLAHVNQRVLGKPVANDGLTDRQRARPAIPDIAPRVPTARRPHADRRCGVARKYTWTAAESLDYRRLTRRAAERILRRHHRQPGRNGPEPAAIAPVQDPRRHPAAAIFRFPNSSRPAWRQRLVTGTPSRSRRSPRPADRKRP